MSRNGSSIFVVRLRWKTVTFTEEIASMFERKKCRTYELWNVELKKEEKNSFSHVSRRGSSLEIYNSAAVSKKRCNIKSSK